MLSQVEKVAGRISVASQTPVSGSEEISTLTEALTSTGTELSGIVEELMGTIKHRKE